MASKLVKGLLVVLIIGAGVGTLIGVSAWIEYQKTADAIRNAIHDLPSGSPSPPSGFPSPPSGFPSP